jgi:hypothetical protein
MALATGCRAASRGRSSGDHCAALPGLNDGDDPSGYRLKDAVDYVVNEVHRLELDNVTLVAHSSVSNRSLFLGRTTAC